MSRLALALPAVLLLGLAAPAGATTWADETVTCPLCGAKVDVKAVASFGSYIYNWPSKFQMVFWPFTESEAIYFCGKCHLAGLLELPALAADKKEAVRKAIAAVKQAQPAKAYTEIPAAYRLEVAGAVYRALGRDDTFFWTFERIVGYHLAAAGRTTEAKAARQKALDLGHALLVAKGDAPSRKELLLVRGEMEHAVGRAKEDVLKTLAECQKTDVPAGKDVDAEQAKRTAEYLDGIAAELIELVKKGDPLP
jgi:hypothetical protein